MIQRISMCDVSEIVEPPLVCYFLCCSVSDVFSVGETSLSKLGIRFNHK